MRLVADFAFSFRTAASAARSRCSGEQFQRCDVGWGHRTEMTLIEGGYFSESKPFSGGDHGGVGDAKGNPMYCRISFGCASQICRGDLDLVKVASHEGLYEVDLGRRGRRACRPGNTPRLRRRVSRADRLCGIPAEPRIEHGQHRCGLGRRRGVRYQLSASPCPSSARMTCLALAPRSVLGPLKTRSTLNRLLAGLTNLSACSRSSSAWSGSRQSMSS
jgi:hypothetical protein